MSWPGQASEHDADHGEADEGRGGPRVTLEVAGEASIATDPGQGSFDDPALGKDNEAVQFVALDDLELPVAALCDGRGRFGALIAGIGKDALDEREAAARAPVENERGPIAVLNVGRMDDDIQQEAECIDEDVPLAARDLLPRIKALRVERGTPF